MIEHSIRESIEKAVNEMYAKSLFGGIPAIPSKAKVHVWREHPPYGTPMQAPQGQTGMALGDGSVFCFDHRHVERKPFWTENTE